MMKLLDHSIEIPSNKQRSEFIALLTHALMDHLDCACNVLILKKAISEDNLIHYYSDIKLSVNRYMASPKQGISLFDSLSIYENNLLRSAMTKDLISREHIRDFFQAVTDRV